MTQAIDYSSDIETHEQEAYNMPDLTCVSCKKVYPQIDCYRCSCNDVNSEGSIYDMFYCDICIGSHIRQEHEIFDCKGYKPKICSTHEMLASMFCHDCNVLFCFKCVGPHCKHDYRPVSEKAKEVRKSVFEYLNEFDELAKPLARRKSFVEKLLQSRRELYPNLGYDTFIDDLCNRFGRIIHSNAEKWIEKAK